MEVIEFLKIYKELGYLGLFLVTIWFFVKELRNQKKEMVEATLRSKDEVVAITERVTKALDASSTAMVGNSEQMQGVIESTEAVTKTTGELVAILKDRDQREYRGRTT